MQTELGFEQWARLSARAAACGADERRGLLAGASLDEAAFQALDKRWQGQLARERDAGHPQRADWYRELCKAEVGRAPARPSSPSQAPASRAPEPAADPVAPRKQRRANAGTVDVDTLLAARAALPFASAPPAPVAPQPLEQPKPRSPWAGGPASTPPIASPPLVAAPIAAPPFVAPISAPPPASAKVEPTVPAASTSEDIRSSVVMYAKLVGELLQAPQQSKAIAARFGLAASELASVQAEWTARFQKDAALLKRFRELKMQKPGKVR